MSQNIRTKRGGYLYFTRFPSNRRPTIRRQFIILFGDSSVIFSGLFSLRVPGNSRSESKNSFANFDLGVEQCGTLLTNEQSFENATCHRHRLARLR